MSRELKFRIWAMLDDELCKWSTGAKEDFNECHLTFEYGKVVFYIDHLIDECVNGEHEQYTRSEEAEIISLEQFTGLKDKTGTDIYEGDILDVKYNYMGRVPVIFKRGEYNVSRYNLDKCKVIGNTHENPELLRN